MPPPYDRRTALRPLLATLALVALAGCGGTSSSSDASTPSSPQPFLVVDTGQVKTFDASAEIAAPHGRAALLRPGRPVLREPAEVRPERRRPDGPRRRHRPHLAEEPGHERRRHHRFARQDDPGRGPGAARGPERRQVRRLQRLAPAHHQGALLAHELRGHRSQRATGNDTSGLDPLHRPRLLRLRLRRHGSPGSGSSTAQYASSTLYVSTTMLGDPTMFGVNFADGRIKGYDAGHELPGAGRRPSSSGASGAPPMASTTSWTTATAPSPTGPPG